MAFLSCSGVHPGHPFTDPPSSLCSSHLCYSDVFLKRNRSLHLRGEVQSVWFWGYLHPIRNSFPALAGPVEKRSAGLSLLRGIAQRPFLHVQMLRNPSNHDPIIRSRVQIQMISPSPSTHRWALESFVTLKSV